MITKARTEEASPLIISASRATDIPAFYAPWLMERLEEGFVEKLNPYNRKPVRISFSRARAIVFWTKNPAPLLPWLPAIMERGLAPVLLFTLNDYEAENWEPNLPPLNERIATFRRLAEMLPPGSVVWRFDPIALGDSLGAEEILDRAEAIYEQIGPDISKLIFSFVDLYPKVKRRLAKLGLDLREPNQEERNKILKGLSGLSRKGASGLKVCSCAEEADFNRYGIERSSCIDAEFLAELCPALAQSPELYNTATSGGLFGQPAIKPLKDRGQRPLCRCAPSRDIGTYGTCGHGCVYCYANR